MGDINRMGTKTADLENPSLDPHAILDRLAEARDIPAGRGRDAALARELGISSKRISAWRERRTLDHELVALRCREWGLSMNWAYFGDGLREVSFTAPADPAASAATSADPALLLRVLTDALNEQMKRLDAEKAAAAGDRKSQG
jgi:hypothetical protein